MKIKMNIPNEVEEAEAEDNCTKSYAKVEWEKGQFAVRLSCAVAHCTQRNPRKVYDLHTRHTHTYRRVCRSRC